MLVHIWTDGSVKDKNPSERISWAAIFMAGDRKRRVAGALNAREVLLSNNVAETLAVLKAIEVLKTPSQVTITTDSQYVWFGLRRIWFKRKLLDSNTNLWKRLRKVLQPHKIIDVLHTPGHGLCVENEYCDTLCKEAIVMEGEGTLIDDYFETIPEAVQKRTNRRKNK